MNLLDHRHVQHIRHHRPPSAAMPLEALEIGMLCEDGRGSDADHWPVIPADCRLEQPAAWSRFKYKQFTGAVRFDRPTPHFSTGDPSRIGET